jgi:gas vesicle protein
MTLHEKPLGYLFVGLLIGSALGALAGILFAPKSGKKLRAEIKEKGSAVLRDATDIYADTSIKSKEIIGEIAHQAKALKKEVGDAGEKIADEFHEKIGQAKKVFGR